MVDITAFSNLDETKDNYFLLIFESNLSQIIWSARWPPYLGGLFILNNFQV